MKGKRKYPARVNGWNIICPDSYAEGSMLGSTKIKLINVFENSKAAIQMQV